MAARKSATPPNHGLPEVTLSEDSEVRFLHLGTEWVQGSMLIDRPFDIELEYVQRMMAWLLFVDPDSVPQRRAMPLGLGAAALTKFHFKKLKMDTTAIEINPQVVAACRTWFKLPPDSARLRVLLGDAAEVVRHAPFHGTVDALQVDLYDHEAAAPVLDSADFYADCRHLLTDEGCLTVNLFGRDASFDRSAARIAAAFGSDRTAMLKPTRDGNTIVLAWKGFDLPEREVLAARAETLQARYELPARKWVQLLSAFQPRQAARRPSARSSA